MQTAGIHTATHVKHRPRGGRRARRRALALMIVICVLTVVMVLSALLTQSSIAVQRERQFQERRAAADFLAESAVERAAVQLQIDPSYRGELWTLSAANHPLATDANIDIRLTGAGEGEGKRTLTITASLGADPASRVVARRTLTVAAGIQR